MNPKVARGYLIEFRIPNMNPQTGTTLGPMGRVSSFSSLWSFGLGVWGTGLRALSLRYSQTHHYYVDDIKVEVPRFGVWLFVQPKYLDNLSGSLLCWARIEPPNLRPSTGCNSAANHPTTAWQPANK